MNYAPDPRDPPRQETLPYVLALITAAIVSFGGVAVVLRGLRPPATPATAPVDVAPPAGDPSLRAAPAAKAAETGSRRTYNVLLLTIDTLRADLGFTGYLRPITPRLDDLALRSTVFERAYATASYTPKSMGPLLIGRYATETRRNGEHYTTFFPSNTFVAERAHAAGVRTMAGVCHRYFLWKKGFQDGQDIYDTTASPPDPRDDDTRITSEHLSDAAIKLLTRPENSTPSTPSKRFLAWFHYVDPHTPYVPHKGAPNFAAMPPPGSPTARAQYDAEVWFTDSQVGRLIDYVRSQPWGNDTAIIVTADHGESFGEHNHWRHGREVWESLIRVPLIVNLPSPPPGMPSEVESASRRIPVKRSHIDVVPTILELLGIDVPPGTLRGKSVLEDMRVPLRELEERDVFVDMPKGPYNEARRAIVTGPSPGTKLIQFQGKKYEAYDLVSDPLETHPLPKSDKRYVDAKGRLGKMIDSLEEIAPSTTDK